jgi:hypothetical protein
MPKAQPNCRQGRASYHLVALGVLTVLATSAAAFPPSRDGGGTFGAKHRSEVAFVLDSVLSGEKEVRKHDVPREADWRRERRMDGAGWKLGSVARDSGPVMTAGLTVVSPRKGSSKEPPQPKTLQHCYVLAAFDLEPAGILAVAIRDPQYYWPDYDPSKNLVDPVDLVWYDEDWKEQRHLALAYQPGEFPDDFTLSPQGDYLLAIRHPVQNGQPIAAGHSLNDIWLQDGTITDVWLPEVEGSGFYPASMQPLGLQFQKDGEQLVAVTPQEVRVYRVEWQR